MMILSSIFLFSFSCLIKATAFQLRPACQLLPKRSAAPFHRLGLSNLQDEEPQEHSFNILQRLLGIDLINRRFDNLNRRFDTLDQEVNIRLDTTNRRLDTLDRRTAKLVEDNTSNKYDFDESSIEICSLQGFSSIFSRTGYLRLDIIGSSAWKKITREGLSAFINYIVGGKGYSHFLPNVPTPKEIVVARAVIKKLLEVYRNEKKRRSLHGATADMSILLGELNDYHLNAGIDILSELEDIFKTSNIPDCEILTPFQPDDGEDITKVITCKGWIEKVKTEFHPKAIGKKDFDFEMLNEQLLISEKLFVPIVLTMHGEILPKHLKHWEQTELEIDGLILPSDKGAAVLQVWEVKSSPSSNKALDQLKVRAYFIDLVLSWFDVKIEVLELKTHFYDLEKGSKVKCAGESGALEELDMTSFSYVVGVDTK